MTWPSIELGLLITFLQAAFFALILSLPFCGCREPCFRIIPGVAQVYWSSVLARFTHTSALAAFSGTPLPELVAAAGQASGSVLMARAAELVRRRLEAGQSINDAVDGQRDIPALWTCVVSTAGPRGEMPAALEELARSYETRARQWSSTCI